MNRPLAKFLAWLDQREDNRRLHSMARYWYRMGAVCPYSAAEEERYLRLKLEEFRTFASARWMADNTISRDEMKDEWLRENVAPMARIPECREAAKSLKAAVVACGEEMFCGEAKRARRKYLNAKVREARASAPAGKIEMRVRALQQEK